MDIPIEIRPGNKFKKFWYVPIIIAVVAVAVSFKSYLGDASYIAKMDDLKIATVKSGDFSVGIRVNGQLKAKNVYMLSADVSGRVAQVITKAGEQVKSGDPIIRLVNPQLGLDLVKAQAEYEQTAAQSEVDISALETALLDQKIYVLNSQLDYQTYLRKLTAESKLLKETAGVVSELDYEQSKQRVQTSKNIWDIAEQRVTQMDDRIVSQHKAHEIRLQKLKQEVERVKIQITQLTVRASIKGVVQSMTLSPGEKVNIGDNVGIIADSNTLISQLQVPELQVKNVVVGLPVVIDTRQNTIAGIVKRVAPTVNNGMVEIDVALEGELPKEVRIDLSVEGTIVVLSLKSVLYVDRPTFAKSFSEQNIYALEEDDSKANRIKVRFGEQSTDQIEIKSGLKAGDKVVISNTTAFAAHSSIIIRN